MTKEKCDECGMTGSHKHINHPLHRHDCKTGVAEFWAWAEKEAGRSLFAKVK